MARVKQYDLAIRPVNGLPCGAHYGSPTGVAMRSPGTLAPLPRRWCGELLSGARRLLRRTGEDDRFSALALRPQRPAALQRRHQRFLVAGMEHAADLQRAQCRIAESQ